MKKKKVSFNIEEDLVNEIKEYCDGRGFNISDFFRNASKEKIERDKNSMTIFIPLGGKIEKFEIDVNQFEISIWDADETMLENVGAICEGTIQLQQDAVLPLYDETPAQKNLKKLLEQNSDEIPKLSFYTKEKYTIKPKEKENIPFQ